MGHVRYALTPDELRDLAQAGCGIGAHGYHHNPVTDKAWIKNPRDFMTEIKRPGPFLGKILGSRPDDVRLSLRRLLQPRGEALAAAGYTWAFAADDKVRSVLFDDPSLDHFAVPRTITYRYDSQEPHEGPARLSRRLRHAALRGAAPAAPSTEAFPAPPSPEALPDLAGPDAVAK